jgi:putative membrane protein
MFSLRIIKTLFLFAGLALLYFVVREIDLGEVINLVGRVGWGFAVVVGLYFAAFAVDSVAWLMALPAAPLNIRWMWRTWAVRMVGEALNNVVPAAGLGGEPVKAMLLKRHYYIGYGDAVTSLILAKTINLFSLCLFLGLGFLLMALSSELPDSFKQAAGMGLAVTVGATLLFYAVQRYKLVTWIGGRLGHTRWRHWVETGFAHVKVIDDRVAGFYAAFRQRFIGAVLLAFVNWALGAIELYYAARFLGHPIPMTDAWIIESLAQMVRSAVFFVPLAIGVQEGTFLLVAGLITGSPELGLAMAVVRRGREIIWILAGALLAGGYALRRSPVSRLP